MAQPSTVSPSHLEQDTVAFQPRRHLLDVDDLSASEISNLLDTAEAVSYTHLTLPTILLV